METTTKTTNQEKPKSFHVWFWFEHDDPTLEIRVVDDSTHVDVRRILIDVDYETAEQAVAEIRETVGTGRITWGWNEDNPFVNGPALDLSNEIFESY